MSKLELKVPPLLLLIIFATLMWQVALRSSQALLPAPYGKITFVAMLLSGIFFLVAGMMSFRKAKTTVNPMTPQGASSLVIEGIYKWTRNPMYVGCMIILLGWGLYLSNLFSLILSFGFVMYMNRFQIRPEERSLTSLFGDDYRAYQNQVRRWL